ncbi:MAG: MBL fold metallo-hydrolase [Acidobacteria bacterium]|nr:MBL fold metallo-hydrolase [Acidobacteriota bacterium]
MGHSRRGFLKSTLGAAWTAASLLEQAVFRAAHANAFAAANAGAKLFDIEKVADGVYGAVARPVPILNCNAVVFELSDGVLIVDTHSKPSAAAALAAQLKREVSGKPVKYVVNSHFHWDHSQGGAAYRKLSPKADVIAS